MNTKFGCVLVSLTLESRTKNTDSLDQNLASFVQTFLFPLTLGFLVQV